MTENQNIEYKQSWHDDYLKWVCGFSNAQGGKIYVGKDDNGKVVGINNYKELLEEIPNKINNLMGITADVNLKQDNGKHYIEIKVQPYSVPISLRGRYYYRSGSVKHELTGPSLNEFLLKKLGFTWDSVIEPRATFDDIDEASVSKFLIMSQKSDRLPASFGLSIPELFEKLKISEKGQLKRAALVMFGKDPGRFYVNSFVKIGKFGKEPHDLQYHELEDGNLMTLSQTVLEQIYHKFLIKKVSFEGMFRYETGEYPTEALREMILNALVHRNYMGAPIQIRITDEDISVWSEGYLPEGITEEDLKKVHRSVPRNPLIAQLCFYCTLIDAWGRGTTKIINSCKKYGLPDPVLINHQAGFMSMLTKASPEPLTLNKIKLNERQIKAVEYVKEHGSITNAEHQKINDTSRRTALRDLDILCKLEVFEMMGERKNTQYKYKK
jgi:ATP-dependent DNA helicase RecG